MVSLIRYFTHLSDVVSDCVVVTAVGSSGGIGPVCGSTASGWGGTDEAIKDCEEGLQCKEVWLQNMEEKAEQSYPPLLNTILQYEWNL